MFAPLPKPYAWLEDEPGPQILLALLSQHGLAEVAGHGDNPDVLKLAREAGIPGYTRDEIPWCGLAVGWAAWKAGFERPANPLWALDWLKFGNPAEPMLGDVMVFARAGGGHVGLYVGEDATHWHVLGGNQGDEVSIRRFAKVGGSLQFKGARRCAWKVSQPENVRRVMLGPTGTPAEGSVT